MDRGGSLICNPISESLRMRSCVLIIDPITAYLGKVDSHKNAEVRGALGPLGEMAARLNVAVICNTHFSKVSGGNANSKIIGSVAFVNQARMAIIVAEDPETRQGGYSFHPRPISVA